MADVRRLVLDVLKPHEPELLAFTERIAEEDGVDGVTASLVELDREVQNVEIAIEGADLDYDAVEERIETLGGTVHSVDEVACGETVPLADERVGDERGPGAGPTGQQGGAGPSEGG